MQAKSKNRPERGRNQQSNEPPSSQPPPPPPFPSRRRGGGASGPLPCVATSHDFGDYPLPQQPSTSTDSFKIIGRGPKRQAGQIKPTKKKAIAKRNPLFPCHTSPSPHYPPPPQFKYSRLPFEDNRSTVQIALPLENLFTWREAWGI